MLKDEQPDWQHTNVSLIGSDIDRKCKEAAANGEPQWRGAGSRPGVQVWRIEQFRVVPWPKSKYGSFHKGDSYIVLVTKTSPENEDKLEWDVHFWIGGESTQDEYGVAAYKTVELDDFLGGAAVQHREVELSESQPFLDAFGGRLSYLSGGAVSGFRHVETREREPVLLEIKGAKDNIRMRQVALSRSSMNSGDIFILDSESCIFVWNGAASNAHERAKAADVAKSMAADRGAGVRVVAVPDEEPDGADPFWKLLPGERRFLGIKYADIKVRDAAAGGEDVKVDAFEPLLMRLKVGRDAKIRYARAGRGAKQPISRLKNGDVFLFDTGFELFLWVGRGADEQERVSAFPFAQKYLKDYKRPSTLPITRFTEGKEAARFLQMFGPAANGCCADVECVVS